MHSAKFDLCMILVRASLICDWSDLFGGSVKGRAVIPFAMAKLNASWRLPAKALDFHHSLSARKLLLGVLTRKFMKEWSLRVKLSCLSSSFQIVQVRRADLISVALDMTFIDITFLKPPW